jgi:hypothetical protein
MRLLVALIGLCCGAFAGVYALLNNPLTAAAEPVAGIAGESYQWQVLEAVGNGFGPAELLGLPLANPDRPLGADALESASAAVMLLTDEQNQPRALATRLSVFSSDGSLTEGRVGIETFTNIFWPNAGSIFLHGYENRWPVIRAAAEASSAGSMQFSAFSPGGDPGAIVGGSGLHEGASGRFSETFWADPSHPDTLAGHLVLEASAR